MDNEIVKVDINPLYGPKSSLTRKNYFKGSVHHFFIGLPLNQGQYNVFVFVIADYIAK